MRKAAGHPRLRRRPTVLLQLVLVFLVCEQLHGRKPQNLVGLLGIFHDGDVRDRVATRIVDVGGFGAAGRAAA